MNESTPDPIESELILLLQKEMPLILAERPVMLAYLFGSVVEGTALPSSDVDIALVFAPSLNLTAYERMQVEFSIAAEIERRCNIREADVRSINSAPLTVKGSVVTEGVLLYSRDEEFRVDYEVYNRKMYLDFLPVVEMMRAAFFEQLRKEGLFSSRS